MIYTYSKVFYNFAYSIYFRCPQLQQVFASFFFLFIFRNILTEDHKNTNFFLFQDVSGSGGDWRFELRVRYLPLDLAEIYDKDPLTFSSYYDQVVNDYLHKSFDSLDQELAIQLG